MVPSILDSTLEMRRAAQAQTADRTSGGSAHAQYSCNKMLVQPNTAVSVAEFILEKAVCIFHVLYLLL